MEKKELSKDSLSKVTGGGIGIPDDWRERTWTCPRCHKKGLTMWDIRPFGGSEDIYWHDACGFKCNPHDWDPDEKTPK